VGTKAFPNVIKTKEEIFNKLRFRVDIEEVQHPDGRVLVFHIPSRPTGHPYELDGSYYMRSGESLVPMTPDQIKQIVTEEGSGLRSRAIVSIVAVLVLSIIGFLSFKYWDAAHMPRQRDVEVGPTETHPTTDKSTAVVKHPEQLADQGQPRVRILDVVPVLPSQSGAAFPALNIYYDNAGQGVARGIVNRFGAGFGSGQLSDDSILAEQDKLLKWDGWQSAMDRRKQYEMHPGDPGEFTSIPNMEGSLAAQFRSNWDKVGAGTTALYVFITFKYFDPSGGIRVTENCFWFSGGFARHECGRGRAFIEQK
jgi:hypothetical protein